MLSCPKNENHSVAFLTKYDDALACRDCNEWVGPRPSTAPVQPFASTWLAPGRCECTWGDRISFGPCAHCEPR